MQKPATPFELNTLSVDELWHLHEEISKILLEKITVEKQELERRLSQLSPEKSGAGTSLGRGERRKYPVVLPKYINPSLPSETWSGRGKQPRWLVAQLKLGHRLEEFVIHPTKLAKRAAGRARP